MNSKDYADLDRHRQRFDLFEAEAKDMLERRLPVPAYDHLLKSSHAFNVLDARGAIGVTERARYFAAMRNLARECAKLWLERREELEYPLLKGAIEGEVKRHAELIPSTSTEPETFILEVSV